MHSVAQPLIAHAADDLALIGPRGECRASELRRAAVALNPVSGPVLLSCEDRGSFVRGLLGVWSAGRCVVLPPNLRPGVIASLASEAADHVSDQTALALGDPLGELQPDSVAVELRTSGTTGAARVVHKTFGQLLGEAGAVARHFGFSPGTRVLCTVPPHHIYGLLFGVLVPLVSGGVIIAAAPLHAEAVAAAAVAHAADVLVSTPAHLRSLEVLPELEGVRRIFSSGAPLPEATAQVLRERLGAAVTEVLGSTETGGIAARDDAGPWTPLPGVVIDEQDGRLILRDGFLPTSPRPFPSDDRIELTGDGRFWHRGRIDEVVKVGGKRVSIRALEDRLRALDSVRDAAVLADDDPAARGTRLRAAVVAGHADAAALRAGLSDWFDPVALPRRFVFVDELPRDTTGKLARQRLVALFEPSEYDRIEVAADGTFELPADSAFFQGHFQGDPLLPGVVELELAVREANARWDDLGAPRSVKRLKFHRPLRPGDRLVLRLSRKDDARRVSFELRRDEELCASATIEF